MICYLTDDEDGRARLEELKAGLPAFRARTEADCGSLAVRTRPLREEDWAHNWQKYYQAFPVGEQLYIVPEWERGKPVPEGRTPVYLNPGLIFGTGSHGTTRLCLEGLERFVVPGAPVLDLGCGSGILAIAALVLGASRARGCDIDPKAVRVAEENAGFNGVEDRLEVFCGDVTGDEALVREPGRPIPPGAGQHHRRRHHSAVRPCGPVPGPRRRVPVLRHHRPPGRGCAGGAGGKRLYRL